MYDDDYVVVQDNKILQGNLKNPFDSIPTYMSVEREKVNEDNAPDLNAQQLALKKLNLNDSRGVSKQQSFGEVNSSFVLIGKLHNTPSSYINNSGSRVSLRRILVMDLLRFLKKRKT